MDNELRIAKVLRAYIGIEHESFTSLAKEIQIPREVIGDICTRRSNTISPTNMAKLIYWLFTSKDTALPKDTPPTITIPVQTTTTPEEMTPKPRKPVGKKVPLSPRMRRLLGDQYE